MLPHQVLQASLVGTAGPTPHRLPNPEPEGPLRAGPGDSSGHCTHAAPCLLPRGQETQGQGHRPSSARFSTGPPGPASLTQAHHCPSWCPRPRDACSWCGFHVRRLPCVPSHPHFSLVTAWTTLAASVLSASWGPDTGLSGVLGQAWSEPVTVLWSLFPPRLRKLEEPPPRPGPGAAAGLLVCSLHLGLRPAENRGCEPPPPPRWCSVDSPRDPFLPCSEQMTHQSTLPSPHQQTGGPKAREAK